MTPKIAACLLSIVLSTLMFSAQSKIAVAGTDAPPASESMKDQSKCAAMRAAQGEVPMFALAGSPLPQADACADPIDQCHDPVKYLGTNVNCACFACEYGKAAQHNVCTQKQPDKDTLLRRSR